MTMVKMIETIILNLTRWTSVSTFKISIKIKAVKVILTMFTKESRNNNIVNNMITTPYKYN